MPSTYQSTSGNAHGTRAIKRMEFVYQGMSYKFQLNPEEYTQSEPMRVTLTQTKGGAWLDAWGAGIVEITMKGTTGVRGGTTDIDTGYNRFKDMAKLFRKCFDTVEDGEEITDEDLIKFYNYTDNEYFYCFPKPDGITLTRSKSKPHMYQYSIGLYCIKRIGSAPAATGQLGNPNKTESSGTKSSTSSSSSATYKGASTYSVINGAINNSPYTRSGADKYTYTTTRSRANINIIKDAAEYAGKMAPIVGGHNGLLSPATAWQCCRGLDVQSTGKVANVVSVKLHDYIDENTLTADQWLYTDVIFNSAVAIDTYEMFKAIKNYSEDWLSSEYAPIVGITEKERITYAAGNSREYDSTLYETATLYRQKAYIGKADYMRVKILLLECMRFYCELYKVGEADEQDDLSIPITNAQAQYIIDNIQAFILYLKFTQSDFNKLYRIGIMSDLRKLEKLITQTKMDILTYL